MDEETDSKLGRDGNCIKVDVEFKVEMWSRSGTLGKGLGSRANG
jgi:hypothetical protein